jgi:hypothetical protein
MTKQYDIESTNIEGLLPRQLISDSAALIDFLKEYYRFLNQDDGPSQIINNIISNRDLDEAVESFIALIRRELGQSMVNDLVADKINLYKHITEFYNSRGSLDSFRTLFRLLFNTEIEISLPKEKILVASDGRWVQQTSFFIDVSAGNVFALYAQIINLTNPITGAITTVEIERIRQVAASTVYEVYIRKSVLLAQISVGDTVKYLGVEGTVISSLNDYEIVYGGTGFKVGQYIDIVDPAVNLPAKIKVTRVLDGGVTKFEFIRFNGGYADTEQYMVVATDNIVSAAADPEYNNGELKALTGDGSDFFKKELTVNGVRLVAAGAVGGQLAVPDEFIKKVARMYELFTDPLAAGINVAIQRQFIKDLSGDAGDSYHAGFPTIQRIARGAGSDYTPNFLTDQGIIDWNLTPLFDSHVANDMVWYLNSTGSGYGDGDIDAQEVIEHVFHTLHMHGLPAFDLKMYPEFSADWQTGDLFAAIEEAYDAGVFDPSGYIPATWKTDPELFPVIAKEYLYLLNFCMFEYSGLWEGGSLAPEWSDSMRTQAGILANNPLGYALFNTYIAPVISKPSLATIQNIFQDGDVGDPTIAGLSGYIADATGGVDFVVSTDFEADQVTYPNRAMLKFNSSPIAQYPGAYTTNNGFLSDDIYLQDNRFYQQFSYLIRSSQQFDNYKNILDKTVHPAGMAAFGAFEINNDFDLSRNLDALRRYFVNRLEDVVDTVDVNTWLLNKPVESIATTSENAIYHLTKPRSDIVSISESEIKDFAKSLGDSVTLSDEIIIELFIMRYLSDTATLSDVAVFSYGKDLTEVINSNDSGVIEMLNDIYAENYFAEDYSEGLTSFT